MVHKKKKLDVKNTRSRPNYNGVTDEDRPLSVIRSISDNSEDVGLVEMVDGSYAHILKLNGAALLYDGRLEEIGSAFEQAIRCLGRHAQMQFLAVNQPFDVDGALGAYSRMCVSDSSFLSWYAEYTKNWFVGNYAYVHRKAFFVILKQQSFDGAISEQQIDALAGLSARVEAVFNAVELRPKLLPSGEIRRLLHSCISLLDASFLDEMELETLKQVPFPEVEQNGFMKVDNTLLSNECIYKLPKSASPNWLEEFVGFSWHSSLSLHFRRPDKEGSDEPAGLNYKTDRQSSEQEGYVEMSLYFSTYSYSQQRLEYQAHVARDSCASGGLLTSDGDAKSVWRSLLPLGIDSGGVAHCVPIKDVGMFCPLLQSTCGTRAGWPIGISRWQAVFLNPMEHRNLLILGSRKIHLAFLESLIVLRLLSTNYRLIVFDDETVRGGSRLKQLVEILGPKITSDVCIDANGASEEMKNQPDETLLTVVRLSDKSSEIIARRFITDWIEKFEPGHRDMAFLISNVGFFEQHTEFLEFIYEVAESQQMMVIAASTMEELEQIHRTRVIVTQHSDTKVALPIESKYQSLAADVLSLPKSVFIPRVGPFVDRDIPCILRTRDDFDFISLTPSPMDKWICANHSKSDKEQIKRMKETMENQNPRLSKTDVARRALYYLASAGTAAADINLPPSER